MRNVESRTCGGKCREAKPPCDTPRTSIIVHSIWRASQEHTQQLACDSEEEWQDFLRFRYTQAHTTHGRLWDQGGTPSRMIGPCVLRLWKFRVREHVRFAPQALSAHFHAGWWLTG